MRNASPERLGEHKTELKQENNHDTRNKRYHCRCNSICFMDSVCDRGVGDFLTLQKEGVKCLY
jgi:hypothetical protein